MNRFGFFGFGRTPSGGAIAVADSISIVQQFLVAGVPETAGAGPGYVPTDEGSAVAWFDPQDASSLTIVGATVTAIKNKISNVSWAAASSVPYEATGLNGKACLHPTSISHYFLSTESAVVNALDCPTTAKPYTIVYVEKPASATVGGVVVGAGNSGVASASTRTWGRRLTISQYEYQQTAPATATNVRSTGAVSTALSICAWHSPGVGQKMKLNNGADDPGNTTVTPAYTPGTGINRVALFCRPDSIPDSSIGDSQVGDIWIFNTELDAAALTRVYNYLLAKWS